MENESSTPSPLLGMVAEIVSAYVANNPVQAADLPRLIESVHTALTDVDQPGVQTDRSGLKPAVPVKKSVTDDHIICLEDGKKFKSLKRHLRTRYDMSPDEYRDKWGLPRDYPMVAPNYAKQRSQLARKMGLGQTKK